MKEIDTSVEMLVNKAKKKLGFSLKEGVVYDGQITNVYLAHTNFIEIRVTCRVDLNDETVKIDACYLFGGEYDDYSYDQLLFLLQDVDNQIDYRSYDTIVESMKILIGKRVNIIKKTTRKGNTSYKIVAIERQKSLSNNGDYNG